MLSSTRTTGTRIHPTAATAAGSPRGQPAGLVILGRYRLHKALGAGGFGTVWMARDERLERDVAVKILARERIVDGRFEREARAAARLSHPGIVTLYEAAVDDDGAYLVSELVRGATLSQLLDGGRLSDRDIVEIGVALSDALGHAHGEGVVHRDVKPSNVLVPEHPASAGHVAKLTDFGVARLIGGEHLTRTGDVVGTAAYMAPEQAEGREAGAPADLYALALVLYEALTGVNPLAHGPAAQRARRLGAHLPPLRRQRRDLPRALGQALDQALRPAPRDRGGIDELRDALVGSLAQVGDEPGVITAPWTPRRTLRVEGRREDEAEEPDLEAGGEERADGLGRRPGALAWPRRALGGAAGAASAAWLTTLLPSSAPVAPAAAALGAGVLIALLPRIGWIGTVGAMSALLGADGRAGAAVVAGLAGLIPVVLLPRHRSSWPLGIVAVGLGVVGLAGAWPALAGRARTVWERMGLGAVGWMWTAFAGILAGHRLYARPPGSVPAGWAGSAATAVDHVLPRALAPGFLAPALIWALAAVLVPWIRRCSLPAQVVLATVWSAALATGTVALLRAWPGGTYVPPGVVSVGAVGAWIVLLVPVLFSRRPARLRSAATAARLA